MRVLFIPFISGAPGHLIPLLALDRMLGGTGIETAFLVDGRLHDFLKKVGARPLEIDYRPEQQAGKEGSFDPTPFRKELQAYGKFKPDVVVDDTNPMTFFASSLAEIPRVTIQRTGIFPGDRPRNDQHTHSLGLTDTKTWPDVTYLGIQQPQTVSDLFNARAKIVPGVRSIEVLPEGLAADPTYYFAGPLLMDDHSMSLGYVTPCGKNVSRLIDLEELQRFLRRNEGRRKALLTFGTVAVPNALIYECAQYLAASDIAIISSFPLSGIEMPLADSHFYAPWLPMDCVCESVDLVVHHCGSGMYHYPLKYGVPSITIGTKCFDRENVAYRLEQLGASAHIPSPDESGCFVESFQSAIDDIFEPTGGLLRQRKERIGTLGIEIKEASASFDLQRVLKAALAQPDARLAAQL